MKNILVFSYKISSEIWQKIVENCLVVAGIELEFCTERMSLLAVIVVEQ